VKTLIEAQEFISENIFDGVDCPCCEQLVKVQTQYFHKSLTEALFWIYFASSKVHTKHHHMNIHKTFAQLELSGLSSYSKLEYWGLIKKHKSEKGYWKITEKGKSYLKGELKIKSKVLTYNGKVVSTTGKAFLVSESLPDFNLTAQLQAEVSKASLL